MRRVPFFPMLITVLISLGGYLGCQPPQQIAQQVEQQVEQQIGNQLGQAVERAQNSGLLPGGFANGGLQGQGMQGQGFPAQGIPGVPVSTVNNGPLVNTQPMVMPQRTNGTLIVGSFNVQRLGPKKISDPTIMQYLANIIQRFDVIAIQEITSKDPNTLPTLLGYVNAQGGHYAYTISKPVGRGTSSSAYYEQYGFIYDASRVTTSQEACFVMNDDEDLLHREPFVGRFVTRTTNPFSFVLINMHTDPDLIDSELNALANVYINVSNYFYQGDYPEDDVILLGDLNAGPPQFRNLAKIPNVIPTIVGMSTMNKGNNTNDNIVVNRLATREFTGRAGILDMQRVFGLQQAQALLLSDHVPVWAEFSIQEVVGNQLASPGNVSWIR